MRTSVAHIYTYSIVLTFNICLTRSFSSFINDIHVSRPSTPPISHTFSRYFSANKYKFFVLSPVSRVFLLFYFILLYFVSFRFVIFFSYFLLYPPSSSCYCYSLYKFIIYETRLNWSNILFWCNFFGWTKKNIRVSYPMNSDSTQNIEMLLGSETSVQL